MGRMISSAELQALVTKYGAVNVENVMILLLLATDRRGAAVSLASDGARVRDVLHAMFRGTPMHTEGDFNG